MIDLVLTEIFAVVGGCKCMCNVPPTKGCCLLSCFPCCGANAAAARVGVDLSALSAKLVGDAKDIDDCIRICTASGLTFSSCA